MAARSSRSHNDTLTALIASLEILQATSNLISTVPFLSSIISGALGLAKTVEKISGDRERYLRLARRAAELSLHVQEALGDDSGAMNDALCSSLSTLNSLIERIQNDVRRQLKKSHLSRFFHQASISATLDDHIDALDSAWRSFDTACLIALRMKMERQAIYDDRTQLRLFRWSDIRPTRVRGKYKVDGYELGDEWEGKWEGRAVVVRTLRSHSSQLEDRNTEVTYYPNIHHPHIAQVVGYSHPSLAERFYVMETGIVPLMQQFRDQDIITRLLLWLQHVADYQNAYRYVESCGIVVNECHSHHDCLSSVLLNEEGRLVIDAADFEDSNLGCFQYRLRMLYDEENGALSPGRDFADDEDVESHASSLLSLLRPCRGANVVSIDVEPYIQSEFAKLWASHRFQGNVNAKWGDYGYIERTGGVETFVKLGHLYDRIMPTGKIPTFFLSRPEDEDWRPARDYPWSDDIICHTFDLTPHDDRLEEIAVVRTLPADSEYHDFFWNHAENVGQEHGIQLHQIVVSEEIFHYAGATLLGDGWDSSSERSLSRQHHQTRAQDTPSEVYFHQLPLLPCGEAPCPWGFWSLERQPGPGPWPQLSLPGVELTCRVSHNYVRVSTFEAEMLTYLNGLRRRRGLLESSPRVL